MAKSSVQGGGKNKDIFWNYINMIKTGLTCLKRLSTWKKSEQSKVNNYFVPWDCCLPPRLPSSPSAPAAFFSFPLYLQPPFSVSPPSVFALLQDTAERATLPHDPYAAHFRKYNWMDKLALEKVWTAGNLTSSFGYKMTILNLTDIFQQKLLPSSVPVTQEMQIWFKITSNNKNTNECI